MGLKLKLFATLLGFVLLGFGAWPLGFLCLLYVAISLRPKRSPSARAGARRRLRVAPRHVLGLAFLLLSALAAASGGILSPLVFFLAGATMLMWPTLLRKLPLAELAPVGDSILLRSRYLPIFWCSVAELKPGAEEFPKAASSFAGRLLVLTDTGKVYSIAACFALSRRQAETETLNRFRWAAPSSRAGAYLLPLDSAQAADVLRLRLTRARFPLDRLADSASRVSGAIILESERGTVRRGGVFEIEGTSKVPSFPPKPAYIESPPLTWEVFDSIGKRTRWPGPDPYSGLLDSMLATRGVPFAERFRGLEASGDRIKVQSLSGDEIQTTRTQLRAIVSIYS